MSAPLLLTNLDPDIKPADSRLVKVIEKNNTRYVMELPRLGALLLRCTSISGNITVALFTETEIRE